MDLLSVSDAARAISSVGGGEISPRRLTELLYLRRIPGFDCPIVGGRRLISRELLPQLRTALRALGELRDDEAVSS